MSGPNKVKQRHDALRMLGELHFHEGKPITAFYDLASTCMPSGRHNELARGSYECGWRCAKEEARAKERALTRETSRMFATLVDAGKAGGNYVDPGKNDEARAAWEVARDALDRAKRS